MTPERILNSYPDYKNAVMALGLTSVQIVSNSCHCGVALNSLELPDQCFILGIVRNNQVILASEEITIWHGDYILAIALSSSLIPMLKYILQKTHPIYYSLNSCLLNNSTLIIESFAKQHYEELN